MYTVIASFTFSHSFTCTLQLHIYMAQISPTPLSASPCSPYCSLLLPFVTLSTYLAPSSCDRNCPPPSQVACKLTLFAPPFTQLSHPLQLPRTLIDQRLTMTTLGLFRSCYAEQLSVPIISHIYFACTVCTMVRGGGNAVYNQIPPQGRGSGV